MKDKLYKVADISDLTGYSRTTVTRWLNKEKIEPASMQANAPLYNAQVLKRFKKSHHIKSQREDKEDLLLKEKDARIDALLEEVLLLREQLNIKDEQIRALTEVTKQAQSLNLLDKDEKKIDKLKAPTNTNANTDHESFLRRIFKRK